MIFWFEIDYPLMRIFRLYKTSNFRFQNQYVDMWPSSVTKSTAPNINFKNFRSFINSTKTLCPLSFWWNECENIGSLSGNEAAFVWIGYIRHRLLMMILLTKPLGFSFFHACGIYRLETYYIRRRTVFFSDFDKQKAYPAYN